MEDLAWTYAEIIVCSLGYQLLAVLIGMFLLLMGWALVTTKAAR